MHCVVTPKRPGSRYPSDSRPRTVRGGKSPLGLHATSTWIGQPLVKPIQPGRNRCRYHGISGAAQPEQVDHTTHPEQRLNDQDACPTHSIYVVGTDVGASKFSIVFTTDCREDLASVSRLTSRVNGPRAGHGDEHGARWTTDGWAEGCSILEGDGVG